MNGPFELFVSYFKDNKAPTLIICTTADKDKRPYADIIDSSDFDAEELKFSVKSHCSAAKNIKNNNFVHLLFYFEQTRPAQIRISSKSIIKDEKLVECTPSKFEFWVGSEIRLHSRWIYVLSEKNEWHMNMLYP